MSEGSSEQKERRPDRAAFVIRRYLCSPASSSQSSTTYRAVETISQDPIGPKSFPYMIGAALIGLAIWTVIEAWRGDFPEREAQDLAPIVWILGGLAVQLLMLHDGRLLHCHGPAVCRDRLGLRPARPLWLTIPIGIVFCFIVWVASSPRACGFRCPPGRSNASF